MQVNGHGGPPLPCSTRETFEHVIGDPNDPEARRYRIAITTEAERLRFQHACAAIGLRPVALETLRAALREAIPEVLIEEHQAIALEQLAALEEAEKRLGAARDALGPPLGEGATEDEQAVRAAKEATLVAEADEVFGLARKVQEIELLCRRESPTFGALAADFALFRPRLLSMAFQHFVRGWGVRGDRLDGALEPLVALDGTPIPFRRRQGVVDAAAFEAIACDYPEDIAEVGEAAAAAFRLTSAQKKSFDSRSSSP